MLDTCLWLLELVIFVYLVLTMFMGLLCSWVVILVVVSRFGICFIDFDLCLDVFVTWVVCLIVVGVTCFVCDCCGDFVGYWFKLFPAGLYFRFGVLLSGCWIANWLFIWAL